MNRPAEALRFLARTVHGANARSAEHRGDAAAARDAAALAGEFEAAALMLDPAGGEIVSRQDAKGAKEEKREEWGEI